MRAKFNRTTMIGKVVYKTGSGFVDFDKSLLGNWLVAALIKDGSIEIDGHIESGHDDQTLDAEKPSKGPRSSKDK